MGAIPEKTASNKKPASSKKPMIMIIGIIGGIALLGVAYMTVFVAPDLRDEMVKVISVTESGCIAETMDGFAVNIGKCDAQSGDLIMAQVDQKVKQRAKAMNPT
jgi:flagellar basal body-associated protein FliL